MDYALMVNGDRIELHIIDVPSLQTLAKVALDDAGARQLVAGLQAKLRALQQIRQQA